MHWRESQKKEDTSAANVREVAKCCVFSRIRVSGQSKSRPVKAAGAEVGAQRRKQKLHAAVAKSTFGSENAKKTDGVGALFEVQLSKIARRCGEKRVLKSKC